jgi:nitroreductase
MLALGGTSVTIASAPGALSGCGASLDESVQPWSASVAASGDPRLAALAHALLAPSSHNTQPWRVALPGRDTIDVYVDPARKLPGVDPLDRQLVLSAAAFVEVCAIALGHAGFEPVAVYFPEGDAAALVGRSPVVTLRLETSGTERDARLFSAIRGRHTNRRPYEPERSIPNVDLDRIRAAASVGRAQLEFITERTARRELATACRDAMAIDVSDRARNEELATWFRFDDDELERRRDGIGLAQGGTEGFSKWVAETFLLSREAAVDPSGAFAKKSIDLTWQQASSAPAFAIITTPANERADQLDAGRSFVRAQLAATSLGIRTQPHFQLLQEYPAMTNLQRSFIAAFGTADRTVQMLFRLGHAAATRHSPRRPLEAVLWADAGGR